jgi:hypothetical protein
VQEKHGDEVEKIVQDAYRELKEVGQKGVSMETAVRGWEVRRLLGRFSSSFSFFS